MDCTIHIDDAGAVATVRLTGSLNVEEILKIGEQLKTHPQYHEGTARLWDCRKIDLTTITKGDMRRVGNAVVAGKMFSPGSRAAILVARDVDFGISRMYLSSEEEDVGTTKVFRDPESAEAWLKGSDDSDS